MKWVLMVLAVCSLLGAEESVEPVELPVDDGEPVTVDAETHARAEAAADAYLAGETEAEAPPRTEAAPPRLVELSSEQVSELARIELLLLEARAYMDQQNGTEAGHRYLDAQKALTDLDTETRIALADRVEEIEADLLAVARELLQLDDLAPAEPEGEGAADPEAESQTAEP